MISVCLTNGGTELGRKTSTKLLETRLDTERDSNVEMRTLDIAVIPTCDEQPCGLNASTVNKKNII